jgi:hypothetical protein
VTVTPYDARSMPQKEKRGLSGKETNSPERKKDTGKNITWIAPARNILIGYWAAWPAPGMVVANDHASR